MLYYIHGYLSEPDSTKGTLLKNLMGVKAIKYRNCPPEDLKIEDCVQKIKDEIINDKDVVLIGSSLGGFLAAKTALETKNVKILILLNPAIIPISVDIKKIQDMPQTILKDMQEPELFNQKIYSKIFILIGQKDEVVPNNWPLEFAKAQNATIQLYNDDHSFTQNLEKIPSIINEILNKKD